MTEGLRVPIGTSGPAAVAAERIQVTLGDGPCIRAHEMERPVAFDEAGIAERWPVFHELLTAQTEIRSTASVPLRSIRGALDIYFSDASAATTQDPDALSQLGEYVSMLLALPPETSVDGVTLPVWAGTVPALGRLAVWQAVGIITVAQGLSSFDALAVLRAVAFSRGSDLDAMASDVVARRLNADTLSER
jgi:hypothetical protein